MNRINNSIKHIVKIISLSKGSLLHATKRLNNLERPAIFYSTKKFNMIGKKCRTKWKRRTKFSIYKQLGFISKKLHADKINM